MAADKQIAEDFEARQDELQALALGAENMDDLVALLEGRGYIKQEPAAETGEGGQMAFFFVEDADEDDAEAAPQKRGWKTIMEMAEGDPMKARGLANWLLNKRNRILDQAAADLQFAMARHAEIDEWISNERKKHDRAVEGVTFSLAQWHREMGTKQESLPCGKLSWDKCRVATEWDAKMGLRVAVATALQEADDLTADGFQGDDDNAREEYRGAKMIECLANYVDLKKTPVKDLLTKRDDGSYTWADDSGEVHEVIAAYQKGEIPLVPLTEEEVAKAQEAADAAEDTLPVATRKPAPWTKPGETYEWKIKEN